MGQGPMTGRRMGRCTNFGAGRRRESTTRDEVENPVPNGGIGRRFRNGGRGMERRSGFKGF